MDHIKSSFYFQSNQDVWRVDYVYYISKWGLNSLKSVVFLNDELYWDFETIPNTRTENPTKSQAKEIIASAKREYKKTYAVRDSRDKKLKEILE